MLAQHLCAHEGAFRELILTKEHAHNSNAYLKGLNVYQVCY